MRRCGKASYVHELRCLVGLEKLELQDGMRIIRKLYRVHVSRRHLTIYARRRLGSLVSCFGCAILVHGKSDPEVDGSCTVMRSLLSLITPRTMWMCEKITQLRTWNMVDFARKTNWLDLA